MLYVVLAAVMLTCLVAALYAADALFERLPGRPLLRARGPERSAEDDTPAP